MKSARAVILFGVLLMISLVSSIPFVSDTPVVIRETNLERVNAFKVAYDEHDPINIDNNTHLVVLLSWKDGPDMETQRIRS